MESSVSFSKEEQTIEQSLPNSSIINVATARGDFEILNILANVSFLRLDANCGNGDDQVQLDLVVSLGPRVCLSQSLKSSTW
jgi:hypothetical protein